MYSLFTTKDILDGILSGNNLGEWKRLIYSHDITDFYFPEEHNPQPTTMGNVDDPISDLSLFANVHSSSKYQETLKSEEYPKLKENFPNTSYSFCLLDNKDFMKDDAVRIEKELGIFCQLNSDVGDQRLCVPTISHAVDINDVRNNDWKCFFNRLPSLPSKNVVISDRYFFAEKYLDERLRREISYGIENVEKLLDCIVDNRYQNEYNVLIFFEYDTLGSSSKSEEYFEKRMQHILSDLHTFARRKAFQNGPNPIKINFELVSVAPEAGQRTITHDRVFASDYYTIDATHAITAFSKGKALFSQLLHYSALFSSIGGDKKSDIIKYRNMLFKGYSQLLKENAGRIKYWFVSYQDTQPPMAYSNTYTISNNIFSHYI